LSALTRRRLLDQKAQEDYFGKIVERYLGFCAQHAKDLDAAWASLPTSSSTDVTQNPPSSAAPAPQRGPPASNELSKILLSLRKLREALLATASTAPVSFSQRVHVFSIRLSILAQHPPSYFPSLRYLLGSLHSPSHPLPDSELDEFTSYLVLDYACRQNDMAAAFDLRARARSKHSFKSHTVDRALAALMHDNWIVFWKVRNAVDSYMRAVMNSAVDRVRRHALKAVGSAYLDADVKWILDGCTGDRDSWTWEKLVQTERLGWLKEGDRIVIKRPKRRSEKRPEQPKENGRLTVNHS
jgi:hypothetical protein